MHIEEMDMEAGYASPLAMEVDGAPQEELDEVPLSGGLSVAASLSILQARRAVVSFLKEHLAEEVVPSNSKVVIVESTIKLKYAFKALLQNGRYLLVSQYPSFVN